VLARPRCQRIRLVQLKAKAEQGLSSSDLIESVTLEAIARHLYAADLPDPDLIIRTSWPDPFVWIFALAECAPRILLH
jgi:hypothetical protein